MPKATLGPTFEIKGDEAMFWALATIGVAVGIFPLAFFLFPWGSEARNPEKNNRWMFLLSGVALRRRPFVKCGYFEFRGM